MITKTRIRICRTSVILVMLILTACALIPWISADDLEWSLLTDTEAGYRVVDYHKLFTQITEEDGTPVISTNRNKFGAFYIYDDNNILGTYRTFSLEGDFYFDAFPTGLRENQYTPEEKPLSFISLIYGDAETKKASIFNAIRIDSNGYIHTATDGSGKTDVKLETGRWHNIRCVYTPMNGISEMFLDGKKVLDFAIYRFDPEKHVSFAIRYFDGYYNGSVKMKNLTVKIEDSHPMEGHTFGEWSKYDDDQHVRICPCGETEYKNHSWDSGILSDIDATTGEATKIFTCTTCSATKEESTTVYQVTVESKIALTGDTVTVNISFADDTDVKAIGLIDFTYDTSVFELISGEWIGADKAVLKDVDLGLNVATIVFDENTPASGLMLSLTFKVAEDAPEGEYAIGCTAEVKKMVDGVENTLETAVIAGNISVRDYARGDVNSDEMVDTNDAIHLLRHILFSSRFEINQSGDMNGDKMVDTNDAIYLLRHVLFPTKFPLH